MQNIQLSSSSLRSSAERIEYPNLIPRGVFLPPLRAGRNLKTRLRTLKERGTSCRSKVMRKAVIHFYARSTNCPYFQRKGRTVPHSSNGLNQILNPSFTRDVSYLYLSLFGEFYEQFHYFFHFLTFR